MTNTVKRIARRVRLAVQCWWLDRQVDRLARRAVADPFARRALMGLAMGLTAIGIIYSPWGQQSGAHLNPAVKGTTFLPCPGRRTRVHSCKEPDGSDAEMSSMQDSPGSPSAAKGRP